MVAASIFRGPATEEIERALRPNEDFGLVIELGHALNAPLFVFSPSRAPLAVRVPSEA